MRTKLREERDEHGRRLAYVDM